MSKGDAIDIFSRIQSRFNGLYGKRIQGCGRSGKTGITVSRHTSN
jgi:hypothetical protein